MKHAVLSDIHSNWEALERVLDYLKKEKVDEYWVLGDTVGYGANPNECFEWAWQNAKVVLMGNHEQAVIDKNLRDWFNRDARTAVEWTAEVLKPEHKKKIRELRYVQITLSSTLAHSSPDKPRDFRYLFSPSDAEPSFHAFETPLCFIGHTHIPSLFSEAHRSAEYLRPGTRALERNERFILNPGSVGQPRDRDPRLSFGLFDDKKWTFEIVRLEYENGKAADKIRKAGLPAWLADRLL
jgi:predicted phosphodiesterase